MGIPVVIDTAGDGVPVVDTTALGYGLPMSLAAHGRGLAITLSVNGKGLACLFDPPLGVDLEPPLIASSSTVTNVEGTKLAHSLVAFDISTVTWSIAGGADAAHFELVGFVLRWLGNGVKDFDAPDDADLANTYVVTVRATDAAANASTQTITVIVIEANTAPTNTVLPNIADTTPVIGETLTCTSGTWIGSPVITYAYQWFYWISDAPDADGCPTGTPIPDATGNTYLLTDVSSVTGQPVGLLLALTRP